MLYYHAENKIRFFLKQAVVNDIFERDRHVVNFELLSHFVIVLKIILISRIFLILVNVKKHFFSDISYFAITPIAAFMMLRQILDAS